MATTLRGYELKRWEQALVALAGATFLTSFVLYVGGFSFRKYFFGDELARQRKIGVVAETSGLLKRELLGDVEFLEIGSSTALYNEDTVITGSTASAKLKLDDESVIELGPDTMVKLSFNSDLALGSISRPTTVELISGKVTSVSKKRELIIRSQGKETYVKESSRQEVTASLPKSLVQPSVTVPVAKAPELQPAPTLLPVASQAPIVTPAPAVPEEKVEPTAAPVKVGVVANHANVELLSPRAGTRLSLPRGSVSAELPIRFRWKLDPMPSELTFALLRDGKEIKRENLSTEGAKSTLDLRIDRPGSYSWRLSSSGALGRTQAFEKEARFVVEPAYESIELTEVLIAGEKKADNRYSGKKADDFSLTVRWNRLPNARDYTLWIGESPDAPSALLQVKSDAPEVTLTREQARIVQHADRAFLRVSAPVGNGFVATSATQELGFNYVPPAPQSPVDRASFSLAKLVKNHGRILFTWQKTNFTDGYEIELSTDPEFKAIYVKRRLRDNFIILKFAQTGSFWWRVRSYLKDRAGPVSKPSQLAILP